MRFSTEHWKRCASRARARNGSNCHCSGRCPGTLVIKEIYCGGCPMTPATGNLQNDQYVILHNNDNRTQYLDGLCFGIVAPSASGANNNWVTTVDGELRFQEFAPVFELRLAVSGNRQRLSARPGRRCGHRHPRRDRFHAGLLTVCRSEQAGIFRHIQPPALRKQKLNLSPGDQIQPSHLLQVIKKTGVSKAYSLSINSPAIIIFRPRRDSISQPTSTTTTRVSQPNPAAVRSA